LIVDGAKARCNDEPISTATAGRAVRWLLHRRMGASQQVRWPLKGAHRMLKIHTAIANGTLADDRGAAEKWVRHSFRRAA
jgi:hypothetical protein